MTPSRTGTVRSRIRGVRVGALAGLCAGALTVPLGLALVSSDEDKEPARATSADPRGPLAPAPSSSLYRPPLALGPAASPTLHEIEALRAKGDVDGLLALACRLSPDEPEPARLRVAAVACVGRVPGHEAARALRGMTTAAPTAQDLDRLTAVAALWERGDRAFVEALAEGTGDLAVRAKARALVGRR